MAIGNVGKRYNVTGSRLLADGSREEIKVVPIGATRQAIAEIEASAGRVFMPTAEDRAAALQRDATFIDDDAIDAIDDECPFK